MDCIPCLAECTYCRHNRTQFWDRSCVSVWNNPLHHFHQRILPPRSSADVRGYRCDPCTGTGPPCMSHCGRFSVTRPRRRDSRDRRRKPSCCGYKSNGLHTRSHWIDIVAGAGKSRPARKTRSWPRPRRYHSRRRRRTPN